MNRFWIRFTFVFRVARLGTTRVFVPSFSNTSHVVYQRRSARVVVSVSTRKYFVSTEEPVKSGAMNFASNWIDICDEEAKVSAERLVSSFSSQPSTRQEVLGRYIKVFATHFKRECDKYSWPDNESGNSDSDTESMITVKKKPFFR